MVMNPGRKIHEMNAATPAPMAYFWMGDILNPSETRDLMSRLSHSASPVQRLDTTAQFQPRYIANDYPVRLPPTHPVPQPQPQPRLRHELLPEAVQESLLIRTPSLISH